MNRWGLAAIVLTAVAVCSAAALVLIPAPNPPTEEASATHPATTSAQDLGDLIVVESPKPGEILSSTTLVITGRARGPWYFEASFPVFLTDWDGRVIAQGVAQAQGDWMTTDFVPFKAMLTFAVPEAGDSAANRGFLVLKKDNPSGDPSHDRSIELPIYFK